MTLKDLWRCPKCGRQFANRNQTHACGHYTVEEHLKGKSPRVVSLYKRFAELVEKCGGVILAPSKSRIGFQVRMIFASVNLNQGSLSCQVILSRRLENQRFISIQSLSPRNHVHRFRIQSIDELDHEVISWLKEAYRVGEQRHRSG